MTSHIYVTVPKSRVGRALFSLLASVAAVSPAVAEDLNRNGRIDPYENPRLPIDRRVEDLLSRMTLEEKIGAMMHGTLPGRDGIAGMSASGYDLSATKALIATRHVNSFITRLTVSPAVLAKENNAVQRLARATRLGIPVTISTDPRNHFQVVLGASTQGGGFSLWPETLGFAAIGDPALVRRFGDVVRREYRATGITMALSPQADLATEPRWPRGTATFGSDPALVSRLAGAYVQGFQHGSAGLARDGVATVVKHWVGYGAEPDGFDAHNHYGRTVRLDDASFANHVAAFDGALAARAAGVMPTYAIVEGVTLAGKPLEQVGAGFSRQLIGDLLRTRKGYRGLVLSDWAITYDCNVRCSAATPEAPQRPQDIGMPWGVETLDQEHRFAKAVNAGVDQFGGVDDPTPLLAAVRQRLVTPERIDEAVRNIMRPKFEMGLFDDPFVDERQAAAIVGNAAFQREADAAQRAAMVLLEAGRAFPLSPGRKVWLAGVDAAAARAAGLVPVPTIEDADVAIVRTATPSEKLHPDYFFGARQNEGRLDLRAGDAGFDAFSKAAARVPTVLVVDADRPPVLGAVKGRTAGLLLAFGASDAAVLDVVTGKSRARGRLPFELPSSMEAVRAQDPARSDDSRAPAFPKGAGLIR